jgi:hypothetical protein
VTKLRQRERARRRKEALGPPVTLNDRGVRFFHGGRAGLLVGSYVLPAAAIGMKSREKAVEQMLGDDFDRALYQSDKAYVSTDLDWVICCACRSRFPIAVYEVEPLGAIEPDPDCERSYTCERAKILRRVPVDFRTLQKFKDRWQRRRDLGLPLWDCLEQDYTELVASRSP